jgi:MFS family permease
MERPKVWTKDYSILVSSNMLYSAGFYMLLPTIPLFIAALGGTSAQVGWVATAFSAASILMRFFINVVLRKADKKRTFLAGMLFTVLITALYSLADSVGSICVLRILQGFGFGIVTTLCAATVADILPASRKGEGIGYFGMGTILAAAVCPALGLYFLSGYGFEAMFLAAAVFPLLAFASGQFFTPPRGRRMAAASAETSPAGQEKSPRSVKAVIIFIRDRVYDPRLGVQIVLLMLLGSAGARI